MLQRIWRDGNCIGKDCPAVYVDRSGVRTIVQGKITDDPGVVRLPLASDVPRDLLITIGAVADHAGGHLVAGRPADATALAAVERIGSVGSDETAIVIE